MKEISDLLVSIKEEEAKKTLLEASIKEKRKAVLEELNRNELRQFKNDIATVSYVERKTLKYNVDKAQILQEVEAMNLPKYIQIIPETKQLNKEFDKAIKEGDLIMDGIEIAVTETPMIRFAK